MPGKIIIKKGLSAVLSASGLFAALDRTLLRDKAFVLMYHRVLDSAEETGFYVQPGMYVASGTFATQISFLKKNYTILFLQELIEKIKRNEKVGGCCAITFDDGWRDNYTNAFPVLMKYQVPATIFLATSFIGTKRLFWPEELCWHLERQPDLQRRVQVSFSSVSSFYNEILKYASTDRDCFLDKAIEVLKGYSPDDRNAILDQLRHMKKSQDLPPQMLSWDEVDEMRKSGLVSFGSHTAEHEILDQVTIPTIRSEISESKVEIEQRLGVKVACFAYPNGNYSEDVRRELENNGFLCAVTTRKGFLGRKTPVMEIPRIGIHEDVSNTVPMFRGRILLEKF